MKPKILLATAVKTQNYVDAVNAYGGIPDAKYCPEVSTEYDGLILCGGSDIHPSYYGEDINGSYGIDDGRDSAEFRLARAFIDAKLPILGICRGAQLLNVALGGSLYQHLPSADMHTQKNGKDFVHSVNAKVGSVICDLYGEEFNVNSAHHQAVKTLGDGLIVTATSGDVVEVFEHQSLPIIGVQWHPERMCLKNSRLDTVDGSKILKHFIDMCKQTF